MILAVDVMTFTGLNFLMTTSRNIRFLTATLLLDRRKKTLIQALKQVVNVYKGKGHDVQEINFTEQNNPVHTLLGDNEFEAVREDLEAIGVTVNISAKEEHVPEIERQHRVVKERARSIVQTLPYQVMPRKMRIALIHNVVFWLNNIPKSGQDYSPRDLVFGKKILNYKTVCRIPFGAYAQVHNDQSITNTMVSRTTGAISLGATGNIQGMYRFLSLRTGEIIVRRTWTELPVPMDVIDRLQEITENEPEYDDDMQDNKIEVAGEEGQIQLLDNGIEEDNQNQNEKNRDYRFAFLSVREGLKRFGQKG